MALVAKSNHPMALTCDQRGQISIFFSASLVVLVSIVAFVINVGLFVKAKINLQNATDAAAFSGAAVQARQLSKIAHLNWEMRNVYKEFLYKYYVIGNLNVNGVKNANPGNTSPVDFRLETDVNAITNEPTPDPYSFPSICIYLEGSKTNICKRYAIPGLPEFGSSNLPGAEAASRAFQDALISTKVNDCIERSNLNMLVALTWAYNVLAAPNKETFAGKGPAIMADRQGAWPKAVELAMRIRNLEKAVNRPPQGSVCLSPGGGKVNCAKGIDEFTNGAFLGNERIVKAFYTGLRNVGGSYEQDEMKNSFTLTELSPQKPDLGVASNASHLLIPTPYEKNYLDLKLMMVNYAIFFSAMIPRADTATSGACDVSKVAIPIPGYPLGYYKNPNVVTYYAVKGEAEFIGMFNPFGDSIKLTTYAAAKPMGGRIGPMLFYQPEGTTIVQGRNENFKRRSVPYMATIDIAGTLQKMPNGSGGWVKRPIDKGEFSPGVPLPVNGSTSNTAFWLDGPTKPVGGHITDPGGVQFGLPNLVYDYLEPFQTTGYTEITDQIHMITTKDPPGGAGDKAIGLFSQDQLARFRGNLGASVSAQKLEEEVARVRAATPYEAANYLVPTPFDVMINREPSMGSFGQIPGNPEKVGNVMRYSTYLYAPLFGNEPQDLLYKGVNEVTSAIFNFMREQETGITKYKNAMNQAALAIYKQGDQVSGAAVNSREGYQKAAAGVSNIDFALPPATQYPKSCSSLAGNFLAFYWGGPVDSSKAPVQGAEVNAPPCPTPLGNLLTEYFAPGGSPDPKFSPTHYFMEYSWYPQNFASSPVPNGMAILSAYVPGPYTGAHQDGTFTNMASSELRETMRRNFYSTKLITLESITSGGGYRESSKNFNISSEGVVNSTSPELRQTDFANPLSALEDVSAIKH